MKGEMMAGEQTLEGEAQTQEALGSLADVLYGSPEAIGGDSAPLAENDEVCPEEFVVDLDVGRQIRRELIARDAGVVLCRAHAGKLKVQVDAAELWRHTRRYLSVADAASGVEERVPCEHWPTKLPAGTVRRIAPILAPLVRLMGRKE